MHSNVSARQTSIGKEFRGFVIQLAKDIRAANAQMITAALEKGKAYKSAKGVLKSKGNKEFLAENDFATSMQRKFIQFVEVWSEFTIQQIQNVDFLVLLKLMKPRYREVVGRLRNVAIITQQLVDSLLKELFPPKPKAAKEATGWKQTRNGRVFSVNLHDEQTGMDIERIAEEEKISRQKVIVTAIALLHRDLAKIIQRTDAVFAGASSLKMDLKNSEAKRRMNLTTTKD